MKDILRQIGVALSILVTIAINFLAEALPINGLSTAQISDSFKVYFVPAGYVFSIWGVIYLGLVAYAIYQALPAQRNNPRLRAASGWVILSGLANSAWIILWHYEQFLLTVAVILVLLGSLIMTYLRLGIGKTAVSQGERWAVRLPFSIYLAWLSVASVANITTLLDYLKWDRFGLAPEVWMGIMLAAVVVITALVNITRRDAAYTAVILWALAGIAVKFAHIGAVAIPTWTAFGLAALSLAVAWISKPYWTANKAVS